MRRRCARIACRAGCSRTRWYTGCFEVNGASRRPRLVSAAQCVGAATDGVLAALAAGQYLARPPALEGAPPIDPRWGRTPDPPLRKSHERSPARSVVRREGGHLLELRTRVANAPRDRDRDAQPSRKR